MMDLDNPEWALVFEYSEWLDADQHLLTPTDVDERTHEDLIDAFFAERADTASAA